MQAFSNKLHWETLEDRRLLSTYFVSITGSDTNIGTISAPFQTIQHAASLAEPGDTIEIRGGIYHETITPTRSGTSSQPIKYEAYNGESVTIDGADPITNWSQNGSLYSTSLNWNLGEGNNQVFEDGKLLNETRWPLVGDPVHPQKEIASAVTSSNGIITIYDNNLTKPQGYWVGGVVDFTPGQEWVAYSATIIASGPGYISFPFNAPSDANPSAGMPYFLIDTNINPDTTGEWNISNGIINLNTQDNPNNHVVEVKHRQYGLEFSNISNTIVTGINLFSCTIDTNTNSWSDVFDHLSATCVSQFIYQKDGWTEPYTCGILIQGNYDIFQNSTISYSSGDGILVSGQNCHISNNTISNIGLNGTDSAGIRNYGVANLIDHNTIYNCGRDGIEALGYQSQFIYNTIYDCLLQTTDGGGIYTWRSDGNGCLIGYNRVYNITSGGFGGTGIYLDDSSDNWTVVGNITANVNYGIKINNDGQNDHIYNNTFDATEWSMGFGGWTTFNWYGTVFANNIFTRPLNWGESNEIFSHNIFDSTNPQLNSDCTLNWNSPAIRAGESIPPYTTGSNPDIGALPYGVLPFKSGSVIDWIPIAPVFFKSQPINPPPTPAVPPQQNPPTPTPIVSPVPIPTPDPNKTIIATSQINASVFATQQGASISNNSVILSGISYISYNIDFGKGVRHFSVDITVPAKMAGKRIYLRLDKPKGRIVGSIIPRANRNNTYHVETKLIQKITGTHTLYLCGFGRKEIAQIDWFTFS